MTYLWTLECVLVEGRLQKMRESVVSVCETIAVNMNMCVLILMLLFVYVCGREWGEHMSMTQSNLRWFPLHVW